MEGISIHSMMRGEGVSGQAFHAAVNIVGSVAGGVLGVWAFSTLPLASGAFLGAAAAVATTVAAVVLNHFSSNWPNNDYLKALSDGLGAITVVMLLNNHYGITALGTTFSIAMTTWAVSLITAMGVAVLFGSYADSTENPNIGAT